MNDPVRERMLKGQVQAADPQPWRCSRCNTPVRPGMNDPCRCFPDLHRSPTPEEK